MIKKINWYYAIPIFMALILAILAYNFIPSEEYDLFRYYEWLNNFNIFNHKDTVNFIFGQGEFLIMSYFYLIAKIGNYHLLQFFPVLIFYSIIFYIIFDYAKIKKYNKKKIILVTVFFLAMFRYSFAVCVFRYSLAYSIFSLGLYLEFIKHNKVLSKILYIIPIFIHASSILLLLFRLILQIKNKKIIISLGIMLIFFLCFSLPILNLIELIRLPNFLSYLVSKVKLYLLNEHISLNLQYLFRIIQTLFLIFLGILCYNGKDENLIKYNKIFIIIGIFSILIFNYYTIFMRIADFLLMLSPIILFQYLSCMDKINKRLRLILNCILIIFVVGGIRIQIPIFIGMYF